MIKYECWSSAIASEVCKFLRDLGWDTHQMDNAVLTDIPHSHAGNLCSAMVKIVMPNEGDNKIELGR